METLLQKEALEPTHVLQEHHARSLDVPGLWKLLLEELFAAIKEIVPPEEMEKVMFDEFV